LAGVGDEPVLAPLDGGPGNVQADVGRVVGQRQLVPAAAAELDYRPDPAGADELVGEGGLALRQRVIRTRTTGQ
jgi:hypothetical protein